MRDTALIIACILRLSAYRDGFIIFLIIGTFFNAADPFTNQAVPNAHNAVVSKVTVL